MKPRFLFAAIFAFGMILMGADGCSSDPNVEGAKLNLRNKEYDRAIENLETAIANDPQNAEAYALMGDVLAAQADEERDAEASGELIMRMVDAYNKAIELDPEREAELTRNLRIAYANVFTKGVQAFNRGKNDPAEFLNAAGHFATAARIQPDSAGAYVNQAFALLNAGEPVRAMAPLEQAIDMGENTVDNYVMLADLYTGADRADDAVVLLNTALEAHPADADLLSRLVNAYQRAGRVDEAMDLYGGLVENDPDNKLFRYNYGSLLLEAERYDDAIAQLRAATEIDADYANAWYNLGAAYVNKAVDLNERLSDMDDEYRAAASSMSDAEKRAKEAEMQALADQRKEQFRSAVEPLEQARELLEMDGEDATGVCQALFQSYVQIGENDKAQDAAECAGIELD